MAIDIETGETGDPRTLLLNALDRRHKRWSEQVTDGLNRVKAWSRNNPRRRISPTRFYRLSHDLKPY